LKNNNIDKKIIEIISIVFNIDIKKITKKTNNTNVNNWGSLRHMTLILTLEDEFSIKFNDQDISKINNIDSIKKIINKYL